MTRSNLLIGALLVALLGLLMQFAPARAAVAAAHRTISNIATVEWGGEGDRRQLQSNRVDVIVPRQDNQSVSLRTFHIAQGGVQTSLTGSSCSVAGLSARSTGSANSAPAISDAPIVETSQIRAGEPLIIEVARASANRDALAAERLSVVLQTAGADHEQLVLIETGIDTGLFVGVIATIGSPPAPTEGDCRLSVRPGERLALELLDNGGASVVATAFVNVLVDPYGIAFDSRDGRPVSGTRVTIVDAGTGQPAAVFGDDGLSTYPSTVVTGETVIDSSGRVYDYAAGDYRFPLMRPGRYRLVVQPPAPYSAPSVADPAELAALRRPDGGPFAIAAGSFGGDIVLSDPAPVRVDIPLDRPTAPLLLAKTASRAVAEAGDLIQYRVTVRNPDAANATGAITLTDLLPRQMRLRPGSVRIDGGDAPEGLTMAADRMTVLIAPLAGGASTSLTYVLEVSPDARDGDAINQVQAVDSRGGSTASADAVVRIGSETIAGRMTIIGRLTDGGCATDPARARGIAGVRILLEDGSYAVTDTDGRYHFEGVQPGTHVVQLDDASLPAGLGAVDCARNTRSGGRAFSRFLEGQGGSLKRVDFRAATMSGGAAAKAVRATRPAPPSDAVAAGAERDWLQGQQPGAEWLFPELNHNPRAPVVRVAIKHLKTHSIRLFANGRPVDPRSFDGTRRDGEIAVSLWRAVPLEKRTTLFSAEIVDAAGAVVERLERPVHFGASPIQAQLLRDRSMLVADGVTRPVIAVRLTDRDGRPVHHGLTGAFEVPAPYYPAVEADAQQARQLAGLERAQPVWRVEGDDGIAYIELEPTTASGTLSLRFRFRDGETTREQRVEGWLDPGQRPWTIVGLAEGTLGYNRLSSHIEKLGRDDDKVLTDGRLAFYAKGRISGKWLITMAYNSDKKDEQTRFGGVIDPRAYYTIYADRSERRYDASSVRKLYLKLERPQFYALFGDYETGIDEPVLARYVRALNGAKAEYRSDRVGATLFAADTPNRHRRDEIQGNGLSGPYALSARDILANSERVAIEVRDRFRSDRIVERRVLARHIDYDIDYQAGTLRFREPILSRSSGLDPQFIVADFEVNGIADRVLNAGGRASWRSADGKLQVAGTAIHDESERGITNLGGADIRYRHSASTELRAEAALSRRDGDTAHAWQVEAEHHGPRHDLLAYAREQESGFGVGQVNAAETGTRKLGIDSRLRLTDSLSLNGSAWHEDYLDSDARRIAGRAQIEYRGRDVSARAGVTIADDRLVDGRQARSQIVQFGATKRFFDNRLEFDAQTELPIGGKDESIDFPARHRLSARYAVTRDVSLTAAYEIADGEQIDARTARIGFDLKPWAGARIALTGNMQDIAEYGPRSFAAYGLSQSLVLNKHWSVDFSLDGNKTLGGFDPSRVLNPLQPVASGGFVGNGTTLTENFTAVTAGATYRRDRWSVTGRAEYRAGSLGDRYGFTAAALRQIGEGRAVGGALSWFDAEGQAGAETRIASGELSWAHRPADSRISWLEKLEVREEAVRGAVAGVPGPIGVPLLVSGNARSRRVVNSFSINWSPNGADGEWLDRTEIALFWGSRYVSDKFGADDISGWSNLVGADLRFDLGDTIDIGAAGTVRQGANGRTAAYSGGPSIGIKPFTNGWLSIGWNVVGFHDRDFEESRYTRSGPYVTMRLKFDQLSLQQLGGRR
jgi:uncharacterized repeat protein (TIGR01451 family)